MDMASHANNARFSLPRFKRWLGHVFGPVSLAMLMLTGGSMTWGQAADTPLSEELGADDHVCSVDPNDTLKVVCTLSTASKKVNIATEILPLAQEHVPAINNQSPMAIQAWGGSGGNGYGDVEGGKGGVAQTVTSLEALKAAFGTTKIEYYIGQKANRCAGCGGDGAASTLVAADDGQPLRSQSLYKILVIAGGGGGGAEEQTSGPFSENIRYPGGDEGVAIATIDAEASEAGADGRGTCKGYGGNQDGEGSGGKVACKSLSQHEGGDDIGGIGGSRENDPRSLWINGIARVAGKGGDPSNKSGGGGGGYGGGGAGFHSSSYEGSGAGGGSYARQSTVDPHVLFAEPTKGTPNGTGRVQLVFERSDANTDLTLRALLYFTDGTTIWRGEMTVPNFDGKPRLTHLTQIITDTGGQDVSGGPLFGPMSALAADLDEQKLYWSTGSAIMRATLEGKEMEPFLTDLGGWVTGFDIDRHDRYLYWINRNLSADAFAPLWRVSLDGPSEPQELCVLEGSFYPWFGVAIDPVSRDLFLTGTGPQAKQTVVRADLEELSTLSGGGVCPTETIVSGIIPTGVAVDVASAIVAWADKGQRAIAIAVPDGSHQETIAKGSPQVDTTQTVFQLGVDVATDDTGGANIAAVAWAESSRRIKVATRTYYAPKWTTYTVVPNINPSDVLLIPQQPTEVEGSQ